MRFETLDGVGNGQWQELHVDTSIGTLAQGPQSWLRQRKCVEKCTCGFCILSIKLSILTLSSFQTQFTQLCIRLHYAKCLVIL